MSKKAEQAYREVGPAKAFGNKKILEAMKAKCSECNGTGKHGCNCEYCDAECERCGGSGDEI